MERDEGGEKGVGKAFRIHTAIEAIDDGNFVVFLVAFVRQIMLFELVVLDLHGVMIMLVLTTAKEFGESYT